MYIMIAANINLLVSTEREEEPFNNNSNNSSDLSKSWVLRLLTVRMSESLPVMKEGNAFQTLHGCHIHNLNCLKSQV